jgi:DNA-binding NtrC family response regulator
MKNENSIYELKRKKALDQAASAKSNAVRELSLALETAIEALEDIEIMEAAMPVDVRHGVDFYAEVSRFETELIKRALKHSGGSQKRAASLLGIKATTLNSKIKAYNINWRNPNASERFDHRP